MEIDPLDISTLSLDEMHMEIDTESDIECDDESCDDDNNSIEWSSDVSTFEKIDDFHSFGATIKHQFAERDSEIKYFQSIFDSDLTSHIITETNRYAHSKPSSNSYEDVTEEELNAFIGMLIFMGIHVYMGKSSDSDNKGSLGERVVLKMTASIHDKKPVLVVFDNFFTSVRLLQKLRKRNIYSCGTVTRNRKHLPETWKTKTNKTETERPIEERRIQIFH